MGVYVRIRNGMKPDPASGEGGASEGDVRGHHSDIIENTGGVVDLAGDHLLVHENDPVGMSVIVDPGIGYIPNSDFSELDGDSIKFWEAVVTEAEELEISANTSGSTRIDLICLKLDTAVEPDEFASNIATLVVVEGTPGAGAPATPDDHLLLAQVEVVNGETEIEDASITDERTQLLIKEDFIPGGAVASYKARAYLGSAQSIPNGAATKINIDTENFDPESCFDTANKRFICPAPGYYLAMNNLQFGENVVLDKRYYAYIYKNGANKAAQKVWTNDGGAADSYNIEVTDLLDCALNDYIEAYCSHAAGIDTIGLNPNTAYTFFAVHSLSLT
jgi:hypothetical protein